MTQDGCRKASCHVHKYVGIYHYGCIRGVGPRPSLYVVWFRVPDDTNIRASSCFRFLEGLICLHVRGIRLDIQSLTLDVEALPLLVKGVRFFDGSFV